MLGSLEAIFTIQCLMAGQPQEQRTFLPQGASSREETPCMLRMLTRRHKGCQWSIYLAPAFALILFTYLCPDATACVAAFGFLFASQACLLIIGQTVTKPDVSVKTTVSQSITYNLHINCLLDETQMQFHYYFSSDEP